MIKFENISVTNFDGAFRGMRNPLNSWDKSDSRSENDAGVSNFVIGPTDMDLAKRLIKAGTDHAKFMRQIFVSMDITAPLYWVAEHDTYKVGTVRNSCSFMHKGVAKPFEINDFSVQDERVYYLLNDIEKHYTKAVYPYDTDEYKIYEINNERKYKVYRNGKIVACEFQYTDNYGTGRTRHFQEQELCPSPTKNGYYELNLGGGRYREKWLLHRLVATVWIDNPDGLETVNHKNGNKADNSVENLEWMSRSDNIKQGFEDGLFDKNQLHRSYFAWKQNHTVINPAIKVGIKSDYEKGIKPAELAEKYQLPIKYIYNCLFQKGAENKDLFYYTYVWENIINALNNLREFYLETKDDNIFKEIRQLLPQGYNVKYTWTANYAVLRNQYFSRRNHRLDEWKEYCRMIESLPYAELITMDGSVDHKYDKN